MKVYTKTGDKGTTSLVGGKRVSKNHPRVEAYGDVDELISYLGVVISDLTTEHEKAMLKEIQIKLMLISAHFASDGSYKSLEAVKEEDILVLEREIDIMTDKLPPLKAFVLPGAPRVASECHVARTICRRSERSALSIGDGGESNTELTESTLLGIKYINRLSDYLFTLARYVCVESGEEESFWLP